VAFNMHGGTTATRIARLSGARHSIGYKGYRYSRLLTARAPSPDVLLNRARLHSVEQQLALLHWAGVPWPASRPRLRLIVSDAAKANTRARLIEAGYEESRFALISPSAAFESKRWKAAGFAAVVDHFKDRYNLSSIVIAGPGQEDIAREVSGHARAKPLVVSGLSLKELTAMIGASSIYVGNDSGPAHIAAALSRPLVVVFGSSDPGVWHPWTESDYRLIESSNLSIEQVSEAEVIAAADEVMQAAGAANKG
jgi:ADP-heptose:LPS heptosyltransferase